MTSQPHTGIRITDEMVRTAYYYAERELRTLRRNRAPQIPRALQQLRDHLDIAIRTRGSDPEPADPELCDAATAAHILGISDRRVREIATDLDGEKIGTTWVFHRSKVTAYRDAKQRR